VGSQIHGLSVSEPQNGWIVAESTSSQVSGFFLSGDLGENHLDGAVAGDKTSTWLCFTRAHGTTATFRNVISIVNPDAVATARMSLRLMTQDGRQQGAPVDRELGPHGRLTQDISALFREPTAALPDMSC